MHAPLEELAASCVPGAGPVALREIGGGLVNRSFQAERDGRRYWLRVAVESADLGPDRDWEARVLRLAAVAGLGPRILHVQPTRGIVVAEWLPGRAWTAAEVDLPANREAMAGLLRRVHGLAAPVPSRAMSPASWIQQYCRSLARLEVPLPASLTPLRAAAAAHLAELSRLPPPPPVLCHSDLHRLNVLIGTDLRLLDWEYSHVSDGLWDVAGWIANNDWRSDAADQFLASYLERTPAPAERARLGTLLWLYDYVCLLWSTVYASQRPGGAELDVSQRMQRIVARLQGGVRGRWSS